MGPTDPDRPLVPTEEEVAALPRWAKDAFAARARADCCPSWISARHPSRRNTVARWPGGGRRRGVASTGVPGNQHSRGVRDAHVKQSDLVGPPRHAVAVALAAADMGGGRAHGCGRRTDELATVRTLRFARLPRLDFDRVQLFAGQRGWTDARRSSPAYSATVGRDPPPWWTEAETKAPDTGGAEVGAA